MTAPWYPWARALVPVATTLAAVRLAATHVEMCSQTPIAPNHLLAPFALPYAAHVVAHMPTVLLSSRSRVSTIKQALAGFAAVFLGFEAVGWAFRSGEPNHPLAYALSLHWALVLLSQPAPPALVIGPHAHAAVHAAAAVALLVGAWQLGPPLPVVDLPGFPAGRGPGAHLVCLLGVELLGPLLLHCLTRVFNSD